MVINYGSVSWKLKQIKEIYASYPDALENLLRY